jgi:hypothetical protein
MPKLRQLPSLLDYGDTRTVRLPPKVKDPVYSSPEFRAWRNIIIAGAGYRCEAVDPYGHRCIRATPPYRMYADHVTELRDGGSLLDPANGQCLCRSHHEIKTIAARKLRLQKHS